MYVFHMILKVSIVSLYSTHRLVFPTEARFVLCEKQSDPLCKMQINRLNAELNPICYLLALLGAHHFLHVSRIRVKSLTLRLLMSYIYIYDISSVRVNTSAHCSGCKQVKG